MQAAGSGHPAVTLTLEDVATVVCADKSRIPRFEPEGCTSAVSSVDAEDALVLRVTGVQQTKCTQLTVVASTNDGG
jgi:hypothetical protein